MPQGKAYSARGGLYSNKKNLVAQTFERMLALDCPEVKDRFSTSSTDSIDKIDESSEFAAVNGVIYCNKTDLVQSPAHRHKPPKKRKYNIQYNSRKESLI